MGTGGDWSEGLAGALGPAGRFRQPFSWGGSALCEFLRSPSRLHPSAFSLSVSSHRLSQSSVPSRVRLPPAQIKLSVF